jgi:hypothetical protein
VKFPRVFAAITAATFLVVAAAPARAATVPSTQTLEVRLDRTTLTTGIGERFDVHSTIRNTTGRTITGAVAHLNVLSPDGSVYVDPEDWSSDRTQPLAPLPAGGSRRLTWGVQAVNRGHIDIYVAVVASDDEVDASAPLRVTVHAVRTINAGGVLPIGIAVPGVVLSLLLLSVRRRHRLA